MYIAVSPNFHSYLNPEVMIPSDVLSLTIVSGFFIAIAEVFRVLVVGLGSR